jgi:hypothetical protein
MLVLVNFNRGELTTEPSLSAFTSETILGKFKRFSKALLFDPFVPSSNNESEVSAFLVSEKGVLGEKSWVFKSNCTEGAFPAVDPKV